MIRIGRFAIFLGACLAGFVTLTGCSRSDDPNAATEGGRQPVSPDDLNRLNVLLVTLDTTRADYLSCYDSSKGHLTPNLDAFAKDGVRFDFAIAQSSATPISHASIMTGLNPYQHGVRVIAAPSGYYLSPEIPTLATRLREQGWSTGAFLSAFPVSEYYGFDHGFDTFDNGLAQDPETILRQRDGYQRWAQRLHQRRSDATTDRAIAWLKTVTDRPFFLWVHYWDPHDPAVLCPPEYISRFVTPDMVPGHPDCKRAVYRAEVNYMDAQFGWLMGAIRSRGDYDRTIVVVVADHGQSLGQHRWWAHRLLYGEQLRVPLIMRVPGWPTGRPLPQLVRTIDIYPTVLEAIGLPVRADVPGRSLRGLAEGLSEPPRTAYAEVLNKYDLSSTVVKRRPDADLLYCVMDRDWKLIYRYTDPADSELYNLEDDPGELRNLYSQATDQRQRLKAILDGHNGYVTAPFEAGEINDEALEALRSLGYVGDEEDQTAEDGNEPLPAVNRPATRPTTQPKVNP